MGRPRKIKVEEQAPVVKTGNYAISIQLGDKLFTGSGENMLDALASLPQPLKVMSKAFITVSQGSRTYTESLMPIRAKKLFHKIARITLAKNYDLLLK